MTVKKFRRHVIVDEVLIPASIGLLTLFLVMYLISSVTGG